MQNMWPKFGHKNQIKILENEIKSGQIFHAYLFLGPDKIGKFTVAKSFAAALQSNLGQDEKLLHAVQTENQIDTFFTSDNGQSIKVEQVREQLQALATSPQSPYKIWLIQGAQRLTTGAANALLKSLEEPNPRTVFIFTATHATDLPTTIVSRMRIIRFQNIPEDTLAADLATHYPNKSPEEIQKAMHLALSKPGKSMHLLENEIEFEDEMARYRELENLLKPETPIYARFKFTETLLKEVDEAKKSEDDLLAKKILNQFFESLLAILRTHLLKDSDATQSQKIHAVTRAQNLLDLNVNRRLVLENMFLSL